MGNLLNLCCSSHRKPLLAALLTFYNLGKTRILAAIVDAQRAFTSCFFPLTSPLDLWLNCLQNFTIKISLTFTLTRQNSLEEKLAWNSTFWISLSMQYSIHVIHSFYIYTDLASQCILFFDKGHWSTSQERLKFFTLLSTVMITDIIQYSCPLLWGT